MKTINRGNSGKIDPFVLGILAVLVVVIIGGLVFAFTSTSNQTEMTNYDISDTERPRLKLEKTAIDLGTMKVSDMKVKDVTLENIGEKPLQITNVSTSCGCTSAQAVIDGKESPIFSMHNNPPWVGEVVPGGKATLKAIYEPAKHPVQGRTEKTILFKTNDPENATVQINLTATVE